MTAITYKFDNPLNFTFDNSLIEFDTDHAQLILQQSNSLNFVQNFNADTGFTYDNSLVEFSGGVVQQKNQRPLNSTYYAEYSLSKDANWGDGSLVTSINGDAVLNSGKIDLIYSTADNTNLEIVGTSKINAMKGCVRMVIIPNYNNPPATEQVFLDISNSSGSNNNRLIFKQDNSGAWRSTMYTSTGGVIVANLGFATSIFSTGVEYEVEFNWNFTPGSELQSIHVNGNYVTSHTRVGTRSNDVTSVGYMRIGGTSAADRSNFSVSSVLIFTEPQHTTGNYTPGISIPKFEYLTTSITFPAMTHLQTGTILGLNSITATEVGVPKYNISLDGGATFLYWSGSAWSISSNGYTQATDLATVNTNIGVLSVSGLTTIQLKAVFPDTNTKNSLDDLTVNYTGNTSYTTTFPEISPVSHINADALLSFSATENVTGSDQVKYTICVDNQDKYWNGVAWVDSDGTFAQTNTATDINANLSSWSFVGKVKPVAYLFSFAGTSTPEIFDFTLGFDYYGGAAESEETCLVWGYLYDVDNTPVANEEILIRPHFYGFTVDKILLVDTVTVTTDETGYWEIELISSIPHNNNFYYEFQFCDHPPQRRYIPDKTIENFNDLPGIFD